MKKIVILLCFFSFVFAIDYFVQGDQKLKDSVDKVFADWAGLEPKLELNPKEDAKNIISYGKPELFGPDSYSLSIQEQSDESKIKVLINPATPELLERVLYHESGLLIGLEIKNSGVMNPLISDKTAELGEEEALQLSNLYKYDKADLNQDGVIDFYDLIELAKAFGQQGINPRADLNSDGVVDNKDLEILKESYVFGRPSASPRNTEELNPEEGNEQDLDPLNPEYLDSFEDSLYEIQDPDDGQNNP